MTGPRVIINSFCKDNQYLSMTNFHSVHSWHEVYLKCYILRSLYNSEYSVVRAELMAVLYIYDSPVVLPSTPTVF